MRSLHKLSFLFSFSFGLFIIGCGAPEESISSTNSEVVAQVSSAPLSIIEKLKEDESLSAKQQVDLYRKLKAEDPSKYDFNNEEALNLYGYNLLWAEKTQEAYVIFEMITQEFPESFNAFDSFGEVNWALGNKEAAVKNYRKSLEMNPDNFNAEDYLEMILDPEAKEKREAGLFTSTYTAQQYRDDLVEFGTQLTTINPSAYKFISKEDFWKVVEEKKKLMTDETTFAEFRWHCNEILANVNCAHTSMGSFYPEHRILPKKLQFPLLTRLVNDSLYVIDPLNNSEWVKKMDQIESINGIAVQNLIKDIYKHIPTQGHIESTKRLNFNKWASGYLAYALNFPERYEVTIAKGKKPITLRENTENKDPISDYSIAYCGNDLCLEMMDDKTAMLTISSFNYYKGNTYKDFVAFMDDAFQKINSKKIEHLMLDLRFNGGGSPESSVYLLRYLLDEPFVYFPGDRYPVANGIHQPHENRFKGKVYCIIDGHGNSTTGHFMAMMKDKKRSVVVGEELGSNHFCTAGYNHTLRLKNTRLEYYVVDTPNWVDVTGFPDERGVLPDHYVTQSIEDYLNDVDAVKEFTLGLIEQAN